MYLDAVSEETFQRQSDEIKAEVSIEIQMPDQEPADQNPGQQTLETVGNSCGKV